MLAPRCVPVRLRTPVFAIASGAIARRQSEAGIVQQFV